MNEPWRFALAHSSSMPSVSDLYTAPLPVEFHLQNRERQLSAKMSPTKGMTRQFSDLFLTCTRHHFQWSSIFRTES